MKVKYENDKFIVINKKVFDIMFYAQVLNASNKAGNIKLTKDILENTDYKKSDIFYNCIQYEVSLFLEALENLRKKYKELTGKELDQKYYVCNQDEPYAKKVIDIILKNENKKLVNNK